MKAKKIIIACLGLVLGIIMWQFFFSGPLKRVDEIYLVTDSTICRLYAKKAIAYEPGGNGQVKHMSFGSTMDCSLPDVPVRIINHRASYYPGVYIKKGGKAVEVPRAFRIAHGRFTVISKVAIDDSRSAATRRFNLKEALPDINFLFNLDKSQYKKLFDIVNRSRNNRYSSDGFYIEK